VPASCRFLRRSRFAVPLPPHVALASSPAAFDLLLYRWHPAGVLAVVSAFWRVARTLEFISPWIDRSSPPLPQLSKLTL
jgi:hypothetical protein